MILNKFGKVEYDGFTIPNLFVNLGLTYDLIKPQFIQRQYTIVGSPRPEQLAYKLYGDSGYEWVLLLLNGVTDPWHGWIRPDDVVRSYAEKKYKTFGGVNAVHHYVDPITGEEYYNIAPDEQPDGEINWYNTLDADKRYVQFVGYLIPVTNVEYELEQNEKLRKINIIHPSDIRSFINTFERTQNGTN